MSNARDQLHTCPHCLTGFANLVESIQIGSVQLPRGSTLLPKEGSFHAEWTICTACRCAVIWLTNTRGATQNTRMVWPRGVARKPLAPEVPADLATDYREACDVLDASAKASAALSRRCLQMLLRDHVKVKPSSLSSEIDELLASKALPSDLAADVDAIRVVGNFAAHPEKSLQTGQVLDVEDGEADWTLTVIEELFDFYFVRPASRASKRDALNAKLAEAKKNAQLKKPPP